MFTTIKRYLKRPGGQGGSTSLETAVILPAVLLLVMGLVESGNMFFSWLSLQKAAQTGTRFAVTGQGEEEGDRMARIVEAALAAKGNLDPASLTVEVRSWDDFTVGGDGVLDDAGEPCDMVEVRLRYQYEPLTPMIGEALPELFMLEGADRKVNEPWMRCI